MPHQEENIILSFDIFNDSEKLKGSLSLAYYLRKQPEIPNNFQFICKTTELPDDFIESFFNELTVACQTYLKKYLLGEEMEDTFVEFFDNHYDPKWHSKR